jgi:FkbH-like protein
MSTMATEGLAAYRGLKKEGRLSESLLALRRALADATAAPSTVQMIGRALATDLPAEGATEVLLLGQCTTSYLPPFLLAWAWADGAALKIHEGEYDNVVQDLAALTTRPEVVILLPWHHRLLAEQARPPQQRVADELAWLRTAWARIAQLGAKLVQVSYDWTQPGPAGFAHSGRQVGSAIALVRTMNDALRAELPAGAFLVELEHLSAATGHRHFYDARNYGWAKQPFSVAGLNELARHLSAGLRAVCRGRRKVLVLDLDNTLWGGVVGETGPHGITLGGSAEGEAFLAFQYYVRGLRGAGVVLAVCSKNNDADAREPFVVNPQMALKLEDFAAFHASWDTKPDRLRRIADELRLGLDSFVFFDDNPVERDHVRHELPEVLVVEVPPDPAAYLAALQDSLAFETVEISAADAQRGEQYQAETVRAAEQANFGSLRDYLASLEMRARVEPIGPKNLARVVELLAKTNQFNLTTRRHSRAEVERLLALPGALGLALSLTDRFGDYGLISVILAVPEEGDPSVLRLDTWLMSCRAIGRSVEHLLANHLATHATRAGATTLLGEFFATAKNQKVASLYSDFQFVAEPAEPGQPARYRRTLADWQPLPTEVQPAPGHAV